uniref:Uncharacterized protein n=1 Tax=Anguilla anguilla TaxID=7936 RepID=A0A0E9X5A3_ANGAN
MSTSHCTPFIFSRSIFLIEQIFFKEAFVCFNIREKAWRHMGIFVSVTFGQFLNLGLYLRPCNALFLSVLVFVCLDPCY